MLPRACRAFIPPSQWPALIRPARRLNQERHIRLDLPYILIDLNLTLCLGILLSSPRHCMHPAGNRDDGLPSITPTNDDPESEDHTNLNFLNGSGEGTSEEESSTQSSPPPTRRKKPKQKHECPYCNMKFDRPSALKLHIRSHTGEKPFSCDTCRRGFSTNSNMRRHIPSCPVRRRRHADSRASSRSSLDDHSGFTPSRHGWSPSSSGQAQAFQYSWPASNGTGSSHGRGDGGSPSSGWQRTYTTTGTPAARSPLPFLHASRYTSASPDIQREASFQPLMPVLEPSYSPHPPNSWPSAQRATYDPGTLPRASTASTIHPLDNSSMRGSPASTVEVARDSQSRFGSTEGFRLASTPVPLQRYTSAVPNQWDLRGSQGSRSQVLSSATSIPPSAGTLLLNGEALPPIPEAAQPRSESSYDRMEYPTRGEPMFRMLRPRMRSSPGQGAEYWASLSQLSLADHERPDEPGTSDRGRSNEDHEHPG